MNSIEDVKRILHDLEERGFSLWVDENNRLRIMITGTNETWVEGAAEEDEEG